MCISKLFFSSVDVLHGCQGHVCTETNKYYSSVVFMKNESSPTESDEDSDKRNTNDALSTKYVGDHGLMQWMMESPKYRDTKPTQNRRAVTKNEHAYLSISVLVHAGSTPPVVARFRLIMSHTPAAYPVYVVVEGQVNSLDSVLVDSTVSPFCQSHTCPIWWHVTVTPVIQPSVGSSLSMLVPHGIQPTHRSATLGISLPKDILS